jgi:hypothetical protein
MMWRLVFAAVALIPALAASLAHAQGAPAAAAPDLAAPEAEADESPAPAGDLRAEVEDLRGRMLDLEQRLDQTRQIATLRRPVMSALGYIDFGFFVPGGNGAGGNGAGIVQDAGAPAARVFPQYADRYGWVFYGDILAPAINSRGEVADLGDFAGINRFDSVDSNGAPGFIVNEVNLTMTAAVSTTALATASVNFIPRTGRDFALGDFMELDLAQMEWMVGQSGKTSVFAGKFDSVIGIEYRERKANQRFGITPTLMARYTTGTPLGIKVRSKLGDNERVVIAAALTNGSATTEQFHFYDEIDSNVGKTGSGRLSVKPVSTLDLEVGLSGSVGAQDRALDSLDLMWFAGVDLLGHFGPVDVKAQYLQGKGEGERLDRIYDPNHRPYGLDLNHGAYLEVDWMVTPLIGVWGRGEVRDALVWLGNPAAPDAASDRLYITKSWRAVAGAKAVINEHVAVKAEYLHNGEYGGMPQIANDIFTSSLLLTY